MFAALSHLSRRLLKWRLAALATLLVVVGAWAQTPPTISTNPTNQTIGAVVSVAGGGSHSLVCRTDGTVFAWGSNSNGQLGDNTTVNRLAGVKTYASIYGGATVVAAGNRHSAALTTANYVYTWGANSYGQLGNGSTTDSAKPVIMLGPYPGASAIACGYAHTVVALSNGTVVACGNNSNGQLGDGTTTNRSTPVTIVGFSYAIKVAAGYCHSLALKSDGTVWSWGGNANGQLGDGTTTQRMSPVQVNGLNNIVTVVAGSYHCAALKLDGTVWTWGLNSTGQLGDGTTLQRIAPVQVPNLTSVVGLAAGADFTVAVKSDGTVWAWGNNSVGQLGDGTTTTRVSPIQVSGITNAIAVSAGNASGFALRSDYTVAGWGNDVDGELGDGSSANESAPVVVQNVNQVSYSVAVTGTAPFTYQWQRKPAGASTFTNISDGVGYTGTNTATLAVLNPAVGDQFACVVSSPYGNAATSAASAIASIGGAGKAIFANPGQSAWTVPPGVTQVQIKAWAAGGRNGGPTVGYGGSGGFVTAIYSVIPGQIINIGTGSCGAYNNIPSASAAWVPGGFQLIAGGGGNGGWGDSTDAGGSGGNGGPIGQDGGGDAQGYSSGGGGASATQGGGGGQDSSGDVFASGTGPAILIGSFSALNNGGASTNGLQGTSSGGCGYYGGGSGGQDVADAGGGGGANFVDTTHGYVSGSANSLGGIGSTPSSTTDPDYPVPTGYAPGYVAYGGTGENGVVVVRYNSAPKTQNLTITPSLLSVQTGTSCTITATGGSSTGSWQWIVPVNCRITNATTSSPTITPLVPGTYTITACKYGDVNYQTSNTASATIIASGATIITTPGTYSVTVPSGISSVRVRTWGAGGTGNDGSTAHIFGLGGAGGFAGAAYAVSPGATLNMIVGHGGGGFFQSGGGGSAVYVLNGFQIIAGAGGGASDRLLAAAPNGGAGGAGGPTGQMGQQPCAGSIAWGGGGASGTAPGAGGAGDYTGNNGGGPINLSAGTAPVYLGSGGSCWGWATGGNYGSGGGGYYGGGGGGYDINNGMSGGGGGGSNFVDANPSHGYIANTAVSMGGDGATPANTADPFYISAIGTGSKTGAGGNGCVVVEWNPILSLSTSSAPPDTTPPTAPPWLNYANASATNITLTWGAATDNVGVVAYLVYRGTQFLGSTPDLTFTDSNLTPSTAYSYTVKAQDAAGNLSSASPVLNASTTQDFSADSDHDGIPDATESALGTNANSAASADTTNQTQQNIHRPIQ